VKRVDGGEKCVKVNILVLTTTYFFTLKDRKIGLYFNKVTFILSSKEKIFRNGRTRILIPEI
jgi:hypothetical protein